MYAAILITNSTPFPPCECSPMVMVSYCIVLVGGWLVRLLFRWLAREKKKKPSLYCTSKLIVILTTLARCSSSNGWMDLALCSTCYQVQYLHFFAARQQPPNTHTQQQTSLSLARLRVSIFGGVSCEKLKITFFLCEMAPLKGLLLKIIF